MDVDGDVQSKRSEPREARKISLKLLEIAYWDDASVMTQLRKQQSRRTFGGSESSTEGCPQPRPRLPSWVPQRIRGLGCRPGDSPRMSTLIEPSPAPRSRVFSVPICNSSRSE